MTEVAEVTARRIVGLSVSANDVVAWVQLEPCPDERWTRLFYGLAEHTGQGEPPMLRADGQLTVRGSLEDEQIDGVIDQLRADVSATNAAYRRGDAPKPRPSTRTTSNNAGETASLRDRLTTRLVDENR